MAMDRTPGMVAAPKWWGTRPGALVADVMTSWPVAGAALAWWCEGCGWVAGLRAATGAPSSTFRREAFVRVADDSQWWLGELTGQAVLAFPVAASSLRVLRREASVLAAGEGGLVAGPDPRGDFAPLSWLAQGPDVAPAWFPRPARDGGGLVGRRASVVAKEGVRFDRRVVSEVYGADGWLSVRTVAEADWWKARLFGQRIESVVHPAAHVWVE